MIEEHALKARSEMVTSEAGKVMEAREVQPLKVLLLILARAGGSFTSVNEVHPLKAAFPIDVSEAGRVS